MQNSLNGLENRSRTLDFSLPNSFGGFSSMSDELSSLNKHRLSCKKGPLHDEFEFDDTAMENNTENSPLLPILVPHQYQTPPGNLSSIDDDKLSILSIFKSAPATLLAVLFNLLDALSYGIIIFPSSSSIPTASQAGISMFLCSSLISQIVFTFGGSGFYGAVGSMVIIDLYVDDRNNAIFTYNG